MNKRHHAQRQHIVHSLDTLVFQLFVLSFFLSPSLWALCMRIIWQFQCSRPRELDSNRSLRFFFASTIFFNASSLWNHFTEGAAGGRAVVLDFVGMSYTPSKLQLLSLDFLIIFLQIVLTSIAYELSIGDESKTDTLAPIPQPPTPTAIPDVSLLPLPLSPTFAMSSTTVSHDPKCASPPLPESPYILDLPTSLVLARLRNPPPAPSSESVDPLLPLPNTTPWPLPPRLQMLMGSMQSRRSNRGRTSSPERPANTGRVPGALEEEASTT
ncbi:hypothetical protein HGRIS_002679 [Hohenbuehelia grisea]|uniref:DUF1746 domain-containing protein n=1 Tax=Hohenbuehelia grisea TaxID=104357 RepID=A0ABR3JL73_9AGAR